MCHYHQTSSLSHFTQKRVCSMVTEKGRITISGNILKKTENGSVTETSLTDEAEFNKALWDYFNVKL
jgi:N-hydroxyarylamine O-acetyltransferase